MFNKELINKNTESINNLKSQITSLTKIIKELKKNNKELQNNIKDNHNVIEEVLDTLENKSFSKDWKEYQKYKEVKSKLPSINQMYKIKELKNLINVNEIAKSLIGTNRSEIFRLEGLAIAHDSGYNQYWTLKQCYVLADELEKNLDLNNSKINNILKEIEKQSKKKDLMEVFKLYAISTDWLRP